MINVLDMAIVSQRLGGGSLDRLSDFLVALLSTAHFGGSKRDPKRRGTGAGAKRRYSVTSDVFAMLYCPPVPQYYPTNYVSRSSRALRDIFSRVVA
eukprot:gene10622-12299_t